MTTCAKRLRVPAISLLLAACVFVPAHVTVQAGNPRGATYCSATDQVFWFIHASDLHIGTSGSTDSSNLQWLLTTAKNAISPSFIVATGDLTDSTNGNLFGMPNGPYQAEWDQYKAIIDAARGADNWNGFFYDLPGNHDAYNDKYFQYYLANSVQGRATGKTQSSWTRTFPFGKYHFLGVNSADNTGAGFSIFFPYGDHAGLDTTELAFVNQALSANADADLTFVFGHHPVTDTGVSGDTWLFYGHQEFIDALDFYSSSSYNYGHTHANSETLFKGNTYTGTMSGDGIYYDNVASLGKDSPNSFSVVAVDCNGVSTVTKNVGSWPVVLITAPVDKYVGAAINPYAYTVPNSSTNPIRALVFSPTAVTAVSYQVDAGGWLLMSQVPSNPYLWQATWNASGLAPGEHKIEVQAGSTLNSVQVQVTGTVNQPPVATDDAYSTEIGKALTVPAPGVLANDSDLDGDSLTAALGTTVPIHGSLTLNASGSFTYTPTAGYSGSDTFTYKAKDAATFSNEARVVLNVRDTVSIVTATWARKTRLLTVEATSSSAPGAALTVTNYNAPMTYSSKTRRYKYTATVASAPASVTVMSSFKGTATKTVTLK